MAPPYTGIVKLKATNFIKSSALIVWIMYFLVSNSNCGVRLPISLSHGMQIYLLDKQYLLSKSCLSLLGGSNVVMGLSANKLSTVSCRAINLGIYREGDGFQNYTKWLSDGLRVGPAIYSPAVIWSDSHALQIEEASINYLKIRGSLFLLHCLFHADGVDHQFKVFKYFRLLPLNECFDGFIAQQLGKVAFGQHQVQKV